ncbi:MAG: hypothetical protein GY866_39550, partial [Proteobacteria bacterium]|nr:hypothetical protein [Pseudomonadota bacterium]
MVEEIRETETRQTEIRQSIQDKNQEIRTIENQIPEIRKKLEQWELFQEWKKQLEDRTTRSINKPRELAGLKKSLEEQHQKTNLEKFRLESVLKEQQTIFNSLVKTGTPDPKINNLKEEGYGTLLADRYEDIPLEWSANLESRLGPLKNALVVKNIHTAADDLAGSFDLPEEVWLVEEENKEKLPEAREISGSILARHGDAWRLSRLAETPVLGKMARKKKIEELREKIKQITQTIEKNRGNMQGVEKNLALLNKIVSLDSFLETSSPLEQLESLNKQKPEIESQVEKLKSQDRHLTQVLERLKKQREIVQKCFAYQELLDRPDLEDRRQELQKEQEEVRTLKSEYEQKESKVRQLRQGLDILQQPLAEDLDSLREEERKAQKEEEYWRISLETLQRLFNNREHFQFADQVPLLEEKKGRTQHLKEQLDSIRQKQE